MKFNEFKSKIAEEYKKIFPDSLCEVEVWSGLGKSICIELFLAADRNECSWNQMSNDMFKVKFWINLPDGFNAETDDLPDVMVMDKMQSSYTIKSSNPHLFCDYQKVGYRKTQGDANKMVATIKKYVAKLHKSVTDDIAAGNIHNNFVEIVGRKIA